MDLPRVRRDGVQVSKYYFAVKDSCYDPQTGETDEEGMVVDVEGFDRIEDVERFVVSRMPNFEGRLRPITKEEYKRDYE